MVVILPSMMIAFDDRQRVSNDGDKYAMVNGYGFVPGAVKDESVELREAKKRIRLLEQEAEVMRRAVAYLS